MKYTSFMGHEQHTLRFLYVCVCVCVCVCISRKTDIKDHVSFKLITLCVCVCVQLFHFDICALHGLSEILKNRLYAYRQSLNLPPAKYTSSFQGTAFHMEISLTVIPVNHAVPVKAF